MSGLVPSRLGCIRTTSFGVFLFMLRIRFPEQPLLYSEREKEKKRKEKEKKTNIEATTFMRSKQCAKSCASVGIASQSLIGCRADLAHFLLTCASRKLEVFVLFLKYLPSVRAN